MSLSSNLSRTPSMDSFYTEWTCEGCIGYPGRRWDQVTLDDLEPSQSEEEYTDAESENIEPSIPKRGHYYFDDGNVMLSVEGILYKIHWSLLQRYSSPVSPIFSAPHDLPDDAPIVLSVPAKDFDLFLSVLYPIDCGIFAATSVDEWTSILTLAIQWNFQSIKNLAIDRLSSIASPVEQIMLGRRFNILEWLGNAYAQVCWRNEALTIEEGQLLGIKDVVKIAAIRQGKNKSAFTTGSHTGILHKVFELPGWVSSTYDMRDKQDKPKGCGVKSKKKRKERCSTVEAANELFSREIGLASHSSLHKWRTKKQKQKQRLGMKLDRDGPIIVHSTFEDKAFLLHAPSGNISQKSKHAS